MPTLIAIDVVLLLPPEVARMAIALSRALPANESQGLVLDDAHVPHVTLAQLFVPARRLDAAIERVGAVAGGVEPLRLSVTGGARGSSSAWMGIERSRAISSLHQRVMAVMEPFAAFGGNAAAFYGGEARPGDVAWVTGFRTSASFDRFSPHITLGHASAPPSIPPFEFEATTLAVCHLGRFCTCRATLGTWELVRSRSG